MPSKDVYEDLPFPTEGVELIQGFDSQRINTTPQGNNVRVYEALTQRGRGGSRAGLTKYIPAQVPSGAHLIQHLNTIVSVAGSATGDVDAGTFPDPSTPGAPFSWGPFHTRSPSRFLPFTTYPDVGAPSPGPGPTIPIGGWGPRPNKQRTPSGPTPATIVLVQSAAEPWDSEEQADQTFDLSFPSSVSQGNLLFVSVGFNNLDADLAVTDSQGNVYTRVNDPNYPAGFYANAGVSGPCTVTVDVSPLFNTGRYVAILEYSGTTPSAVDGYASRLGNETDVGAYSDVVVPVSGVNGLVIAYFQTAGVQEDDADPPSFTPGFGWTLRGGGFYHDVVQGGTLFYSFFIMDKVGASSPSPLLASGDYVPREDPGDTTGWFASGVSFRHS